MTEDKTKEETKSRTTAEIAAIAQTFVKFMEDHELSAEEGICALSLANSLLQVNLTMNVLIKNAQVVKMPIPPTILNKPSDN